MTDMTSLTGDSSPLLTSPVSLVKNRNFLMIYK